ncbi:UNVERIFIED_CONTAM: hypothetical protein K2H54_006338 [Gekko kuhli]
MGPGAALLRPLAWCLLVLPLPVAPSTAVPTPFPEEASVGPGTAQTATPDTSQGPTAPGEETPAAGSSPSAGSPAETPGPSPAETPGPSPASTRGPSSTAGPPTVAPHPGPLAPARDGRGQIVCL